MNDNRKKNKERQAHIARLLEKNERINVNQLFEILQVSKETIRRDLKEMEEAGIIQRVHGGAVLSEASKGVKEYPLLTREIRNYSEKIRLCQKAAEYIEDGDTIFIDNSSTTLNLVSYIPQDYRVTIITNSIRLLVEASIADHPSLTFICLGGLLKSKNYSLTGVMAVEQIHHFRPNKAFVSCHGISMTDGITDGSIYEVDAKREMLKQAKKTFLLADSSKIGKTGVVVLSQFDFIDCLITDETVSEEYRHFIESQGTEIVTLQ